MERVKSQKYPEIEWEYHFENMGTKISVATMYYKGNRALELTEDRYGHKVSLEYEYRFVVTYCSIYVRYSDEEIICERENKVSDNEEEYTKNKLIIACDIVEKKFMEIIQKVKAVI